MQKFEIPVNIAEQITALNAKIREESPEREISIKPKYIPFGHNGRVLNIPAFDVFAEGSGKFSSTAQTAKTTLLEIINGQIAEAARQAIEQQIEEEEAERESETAHFAARLEEEKQRAKEAAEAAEKAAEEQRQRLQKEAAEKEGQLLSQLAAIAAAKTARYNKASRIMAGFSMVLLALVCIVGTAMNYHNVRVLYGQIFHPFIIALFAFVLAFIPIIFAWVRDDIKVEQSTVILPIDYAVTVILFVFCNPVSPLVQNWQWLAENSHWVLLTASLLGVGFYAYQTYLIYNKLLAIIASEKYKSFFMSLFD